MIKGLLIRFLTYTAWPMVEPEAYGAFHLSFFLIGLMVSVLLACLLRKVQEKGFRIIMLSCGVFLLLTEIYKQLFYTFVIGNGEYQWWIIPFQLCSIPMYFCLLVAFMKPCKARDIICNFMLAFNLMGGFVAFIEPSGLVHEYWTLTLHAFLWHMIIVFVGLYLGISGRAGNKMRDYIPAASVFVMLSVIAFLINLILRNVSDESINMFYVGPSISPIVVFEDIATRFGWYVNTPIYLFCICIAAFLFFFPFALARRNGGIRNSHARSI